MSFNHLNDSNEGGIILTLLMRKMRHRKFLIFAQGQTNTPQTLQHGWFKFNKIEKRSF